MRDFGIGTFGARYADTYDANLTDMADETQSTVAFLADVAPGLDVLELASGTGRVALPLAARGMRVTGVESSPEMVAKMREKPGGDGVPVVVGDMAEVPVEGPFDAAVLVFNTLFNLTSQEAQVRCFQNVARVLRPGGIFVVETFLPSHELADFSEGQSVRARHVDIDHIRLDVRTHDPMAQTIAFQRVRLSAEGTQMAPLLLRYAWPSELDLMARLAGMSLRERWEGWDRAPFTASSTRHISVYAL